MTIFLEKPPMAIGQNLLCKILPLTPDLTIGALLVSTQLMYRPNTLPYVTMSNLIGKNEIQVHYSLSES